MEKKIFLFGVIFLLFSCTQKKTDFFDIDTFGKIKAGVIFKKIEIIPLENKPEAMIGYCRKFIYYNKSYYELDYGIPFVRMYDEKGNFIRSIGVSGKGPGELLDIRDFEINRFTNNIELCGNMKSSIMVYDTSNMFIYHRILPKGLYTVNKFLHISEDIIALYTPNNPDYKIYLYSQVENKIIEKFYTGLNYIYSDFCSSQYPFGNFNDFVYFTDVFDGMIYQFDLTKNKLLKYKKFNFGKYDFDISSLPNINIWRDLVPEKKEEIINNTYKFVTPADKYLETEKYYLYLKRNADIILRDKNNNTNYTFNGLQETKRISVLGMTDSFIYGIFPAKYINDFISEELIGKTEFEKFKNLKKEDNQVVIKYYFK